MFDRSRAVRASERIIGQRRRSNRRFNGLENEVKHGPSLIFKTQVWASHGEEGPDHLLKGCLIDTELWSQAKGVCGWRTRTRT